eukprot:gene18799-26602_t
MFDFGTQGKVNISMSGGYIEEILLYTKVRASDRAITPATAKLFDIDEKSSLLNETDKFGFHSMFLTTRVSSPNEQDLTKLTRVIHYLNDTKHLGLTLQVQDHIKVLAYVDASHGTHSSKFQGAYGTIFGQGAVHAKSSKQKLNSKSSTETELIVGLSDYLSQVLWIRKFLHAQGYNTKLEPAIIFQDNNKSTITMANKGKHIDESTRHIDIIRYFFVKHYLDSNEVNIKYLPTELMIADILTKPLQGSLFKTLR